MKKELRVNLSLLKELVRELENYLVAVENMKELKEFDKNQFIIELSKATGICSGVMQEAGLLIGDIQTLSLSVQDPTTDKLDLGKLITSLKGGGAN